MAGEFIFPPRPPKPKWAGLFLKEYHHSFDYKDLSIYIYVYIYMEYASQL